jgi:predicted nucleic acid-binding protein
MLFDASAIFNAYQAGEMEALYDAQTIELSIFELGNTINRLTFIERKVNATDGATLMGLFEEIFEKMKKVSPGSSAKILGLAGETGLTFYDASYLSAAIENHLELVTDDKALIRAALGSHVKVASTSEL